MIWNWFNTDDNNINGEYNFTIDYQPKIAQTNSNLNIVCYRNKNKKSIVPIRVKWFKLKNQLLTEIVGIKGSTYPCEPSDLGCRIKAQITSLDQQARGTAQLWFGPICIEISLKQMLINILYSGHNLFPIYTIKDKQKQATLKINSDEIIVIDTNSQKSVKFEYSLSDPRLELNPKDITKLYLRFRDQNAQQKLKIYMSSVYEEGQKGQKSMKSQSRLFRNENKLQIKFLSRYSRDLFIFAIKAFSTKKELRNSLVIEKIQKLDFNNDELFNKFFQFQSLKNDIIRVNILNKQLQVDRDQKITDLKLMEEQITNITTTYTKIIENKFKDQIQLNQSYSQITHKRDQMVGKNKIHNLQKENQMLQLKIKQLTEKNELLQFFKKGNDSMMHSRMFLNQSAILPSQKQQNALNPFEKKSNRFYEEPVNNNNKNLLELSKMNIKLLQQNKILKQQNQRIEKEKSKNQMINILDSLDNQAQDQIYLNKYKNLEKKYSALEEKYQSLNKLHTVLKTKYQEIQNINIQLQKQANRLRDMALNHSITIINKSRNQSIHDISNNNIIQNSLYNQSMNSEIELRLLQEKFLEMKVINQRLLGDNERLTKQKSKYKKQAEYLLEQIKQLKKSNTTITNSNIPTQVQTVSQNNSNPLGISTKSPINQQQKPSILVNSRIVYDQQNSIVQNSEILRLKEQNQQLLMQKNNLSKKYQTLVNQSQKLKNYLQLEHKYQSLYKLHQSCSSKIKQLQQQIFKIRNQTLVQSRVQINDTDRLKQINSNLNNEINNLKKELQMIKHNQDYETIQTLNRKIFQLNNQIEHSKNNNKQSINKIISDQLFTCKKNLQSIQTQCEDKDKKIKALNQTIQKLMIQNNDKNQRSFYSQLNTSGSGSIQKYKKKIKQLQNQVKLLRKNAVALNRSRDLSMDMELHNSQMLETLKQQLQGLLKENERISQMCQKYSKEAKQMNKVRQENINLKRKIQYYDKKLKELNIQIAI